LTHATGGGISASTWRLLNHIFQPDPMGRTPRRPLTGIRVLDLTQFLSGPCDADLADLRRDIIKLDRRKAIPFACAAISSGRQRLLLCINRTNAASPSHESRMRGAAGKRSPLLDIVMENFRPGVLERWSFRQACARKSRADWCSISGFGQDGPYRNKPATT